MTSMSRRTLLATTLVTGFGLAAAASEPAGLAGYLYTADEHGSSISIVQLGDGSVATIPIAIAPHNAQVTADGRWLLAVGEPATDGHGHGHAHGDAPAGRLLVFDARDVAAGPVAEVAVGDHPAHVVADAAASRAFVTASGDDAVMVVDLETHDLVATVSTGASPHGLRPSPDGRTLYVANVANGSVSVIDVDALDEVARIAVGAAPVQVGFLPDGSRVYVSLRDDDAVAVIDTRTREVVDRIAVGRGPIQVHASPDGRHVYVANEGSAEHPGDTVSAIDVDRGEVVATIRTGLGAHGVAVSDDGAWVFVTNIAEDTVAVVDRASHRVVRTHAVGRGPNGITFRAAND